MDTRAMRTLTLVAGVAWLVVAGYGLRSAVVDDGDDWQLAYLVFSLALLVGAGTSVAVAAGVTRQSVRPRLRMVGLVVGSVGGVASIVAWALPLWMTVLGVGFAMVTVATAAGKRRAVALLAASQLVGLAAMFAGIAAEVGRRDEWGDYPAAGGIALVVTGVMTVVALFEITKRVDRQPVIQGGAAFDLGVSSAK
jgi:hypothetical protein